MGISDKAKIAAEDVVGKVKEVVGDATDDKSLQAEGRTDQAKASGKSTVEDVKDAFRK